MACCRVGLLLIYQLIDASQRCQRGCRTPFKWFGILSAADAGAGGAPCSW